MSTVTLTIGTKTYSVACADGEEAHIEALGAMIAEKYDLLGSSRAPLEAQNLLFAALFLADELTEARRRLAEPPPAPDTSEIDTLLAANASLQSQLEAAIAASGESDELFGGPDAAESLADQLEALAAKAEASAEALEASIPNA